MSCTTGRSDPRRSPTDFYATPEWCTKAVCRWIKQHENVLYDNSLVPLSILDPGAGTGAILRVLYSEWPNAELTSIEIDDQLCALMRDNPPDHVVGRPSRTHMLWADFLQHGLLFKPHYDLCVCNPPFSGPNGEDYALAFIEHAMSMCSVGAFLVRLNWLAAAPTKEKAARYEYLKEHPPCVLVLGKRPSFTKRMKMVVDKKTGKLVKRTTSTDGTEYAWIVFGVPGTEGRWELLDAEEGRP